MKTRAWDGKRFRDDHFIDANGYVYQSWCLNSGHFTLSRVDWKLSRFTNWKDTNGNVICQHHIVDSINSRRRYLIDWDENNGSFVARRIYSNEEYANYPFVEKTARNCTIIGDIFQNPELLEEVK